jgi:hypothetical protein
VRPHDALELVVDDHGNVLVVPTIGQLVDTDALEAVELIPGAVALDDPGDDGTDGSGHTQSWTGAFIRRGFLICTMSSTAG